MVGIIGIIGHFEAPFIIMLLAIFVYFMPTLIAFKRLHLNRVAIFVLNLLLGWTFLGWVIAFVWGFTSNTEGKQQSV